MLPSRLFYSFSSTILAISLCFAVLLAVAQEAPKRSKRKGIPILRAIPIPQIRKAERIPENTPSPLDQTPMPILKAIVIEDAPEKKIPPPAPGLTSTSKDQLEYANLVYTYEHYDLAVHQYEKFIADHPADPGVEEARYRLGESYLKLKKEEQAETSYRDQLRLFPRGTFAPAGAYRLGSLRYGQGDYETAELNFGIAATNSEQHEIKLASSFYRACSLDALGRNAESNALYASLEKDKKDNPYRDAAQLYLARHAFDSDRTAEALKRFSALAESSTSPAIVAESLVKAGLLHSDEGRSKEADAFLTKALEIEEGQQWKSVAFFALIQNKYTIGDYEGVVTTYKDGFEELPDQSRAKMLLMAGNAYRNLSDHERAIETYSLVEKHFPEYLEGQEAGYRKLLCYHDTADPELPAHIDSYVETQRDLAPEVSYIDMALMLKAENLFAKADYPGAAAAYSEVRASNILPNLRPSRLYKLGWSLTESGDAARAVGTLTDFIILNPTDPLAPSALAQRAISYKALRNPTAAIGDLQRIVSVFPKTDAAEFAWQQLALLHGQNREMEEMITAFTSLIENFPNTRGAAEAWYWIGYAHFELKQYREAIEPLTKARNLDAGSYQQRATLRSILAYFHLQDAENLQREVEIFLESKPEISIPSQVLVWLGLDLFSHDKFVDSERFLNMSANHEDPSLTKGEVWSHLGKARIELGKYDEAIEALDQYMTTLNKPSSKAKALLDKSIAQLGLKVHDEALETARGALTLEKQGRTNALIRMHLGDIAMSRQLYDDAAREYIIISEIFLDPELTPRAMSKAADAVEKAGNTEKAESIRANLRVQFPNFGEE